MRLEAVIALRKTPTAEAARTALAVLDLPMDEFLDFALWQTMRELEPAMMARLKTEPEFLGNARENGLCPDVGKESGSYDNTAGAALSK